MPEANTISAHMEVLGSDGGHVGTVDGIEEDRIKLTRQGSADGQHHYVAKSLVQDIKGNTITLTVPAAQALPDDEAPLPEDPQMGVATGIG